jgi:hypothetical protein
MQNATAVGGFFAPFSISAQLVSLMWAPAVQEKSRRSPRPSILEAGSRPQFVPWQAPLPAPELFGCQPGPDLSGGLPVRKPDFKAPALGHGFMFDEADWLGHSRQ